jgi:UDPglucose 6-dehydrogenase
MGLDDRIGSSFLRAGIGYGGECFPKDVRAFRHKADDLGVGFALLAEVERVNGERIEAFVDKIRSILWGLDGRRVALWGLSFKPETDDLRNSRALEVARRLVVRGARVTAFDPVAMPAAKLLIPEVELAVDPYDAARDAHCLAVCTEWSQFATADLDRLRTVMARPVIVDGRNVFDPVTMAEAGFTYASVGRPTVGPEPRR